MATEHSEGPGGGQEGLVLSGGVQGILALDPSLRDPRYDHDFTGVQDTVAFYRGGEVYRRPEGWKRLALRVLDKFDDGNEWLGGTGRKGQSSVVGEWPVSYHGTTPQAAIGIAQEGYRLDMGKRFGYGRGIYSSPDPSTARSVAPAFTVDGTQFKLIIQNRVRPDTLRKVQHVGLGHGEEWLCKNDRDIRPYAICLKRF